MSNAFFFTLGHHSEWCAKFTKTCLFFLFYIRRCYPTLFSSDITCIWNIVKISRGFFRTEIKMKFARNTVINKYILLLYSELLRRSRDKISRAKTSLIWNGFVRFENERITIYVYILRVHHVPCLRVPVPYANMTNRVFRHVNKTE